MLLVTGLFVLIGALIWEIARRKRAHATRHAAWKLHHDWLHGKTAAAHHSPPRPSGRVKKP